MATKPKLSRRSEAEYRAIGKLVEDMYLANSLGSTKILWLSFLRGLAYGLGIFLAGTLVIALLAWILSLFDEAPIIGPLVQNIINSLD